MNAEDDAVTDLSASATVTAASSGGARGLLKSKSKSFSNMSFGQKQHILKAMFDKRNGVPPPKQDPPRRAKMPPPPPPPPPPMAGDDEDDDYEDETPEDAAAASAAKKSAAQPIQQLPRRPPSPRRMSKSPLSQSVAEDAPPPAPPSGKTGIPLSPSKNQELNNSGRLSPLEQRALEKEGVARRRSNFEDRGAPSTERRTSGSEEGGALSVSRSSRRTCRSTPPGPSISVQLPSPSEYAHPPQPQFQHHPQLVYQAAPAPTPPIVAGPSDQLFKQTVLSFEQCLHHAMDMNTMLLQHLARGSAAATTAVAATPAAARTVSAPIVFPSLHHHHPHFSHAGSPGHGAKSPTCNYCHAPPLPAPKPVAAAVPRRSESSRAEDATNYARGVQRLQDLVALVRANTQRQAKVMAGLQEQACAEQHRRAQREVDGLVQLLATGGGGGAGKRGHGM
ncbi:hypothetical protein H9P43_007303 [Blastocladiella emersonii ATCC 22665]|nr:hypothetical protein H9P43_007303 [Blastocladiella emersonii ATCC 22665]